MGSSVVVRRESGLVIATLNRPDKLNILNKEVFDDLKSLLDVLETDKTVRTLILTGAGEKAFCVGADLKERQGMTDKDVLQRFELVRQLYLRLEKLGFPVIAAMNGSALGGGLELALACDLRVVVESAQLGLPEVDLGIIPGNGGTQRLARVVGMARALEMIFLAKKISAAQALAMGLVHGVVPTGQALSHAKTWATKMAESGPLALKQAKLAVRQGITRELDNALGFEIECYRPLLGTKDRTEGIKAFFEKRKPAYRGE